MDELVSEGNFALIRAATTFDFSQHTRFSTYACAALNKTLTKFVSARSGRGVGQQPKSDDLLSDAVDYRAAGPRRDAWQQGLRDQVTGLLNQLGDRERLVIEQRYPLNEAARPATLKAVGDQIAVSVERVRQLEQKALGRLKELALQQGLEPFED
jgi:RNA polymerase sigma factor (sigma-70 family)